MNIVTLYTQSVCSKPTQAISRITNKSWLSVLASVVMLSASSITHAAPAPIKGLDNPNRIPGQYIVVLKPKSEPASKQASAGSAASNVPALASKKGFHVKHQFHSAFNGYTIKNANAAAAKNTVSAQAGNDDALLNELANNPDVAFIEADQMVNADSDIVTSRSDASSGAFAGNAIGGGIQSPISTDLWGLDRINQRSLPLDNSYSYTKTGLNVHAYVLDSGLNASHEEFTGRISDGQDFVQDGMGTNDCIGHGTHVAGTIGGTRFGVAKQAIIHPVRVLDCTNSAPWSTIIAGIDWVIANHQSPALINMSIWGGRTEAVNMAVDNAVAAGISVIVIAGNDAADACNVSPASTASAITVGASDKTDVRSTFSSIGGCVDLFAPGTDITSATIPGTQSTAVMSGTSMAAPHVAGVVARYLEKNPSATPQQVSSAITAMATQSTLTNVGTGSPNLLLDSDVDTDANWKRTVVFIYGETKTGQDMFVRGGLDKTYAKNKLGIDCTQANMKCAIPIRHLNLRNATTAPWKKNDNYLDWYGVEPSQSSAAQGSPLDWTTNLWPTSWGPKRTVEINGSGETPLNVWGSHYWMLDVEMDCSRTSNGWFEVKSFISNGPGWENDIAQPRAPWISKNHFGQCGKLNVFKRNQNSPVTIGTLN